MPPPMMSRMRLPCSDRHGFHHRQQSPAAAGRRQVRAQCDTEQYNSARRSQNCEWPSGRRAPGHGRARSIAASRQLRTRLRPWLRLHVVPLRSTRGKIAANAASDCEPAAGILDLADAARGSARSSRRPPVRPSTTCRAWGRACARRPRPRPWSFAEARARSASSCRTGR